MKLKNEHIFVTGGADGIGAACVLDAAQAGAKVPWQGYGPESVTLTISEPQRPR